MVPPTLNPADTPPVAGTPAAGPPTYGELLAAAATSSTAATSTAIGPFDDPHHAAATVNDYMRFLAVSGRHATLLLSARTEEDHGTSPYAAAAREAAAGLAKLTATRGGSTGWTRCGDQLGAAHDILATHLGPRGEPHSPEAAELAWPTVCHAAVLRVLGLSGRPLAVAPEFISAVAAAQPQREPPLSPWAISQLRRTTTELRRLLDATHPEVSCDPSVLDAVDATIAARPKLVEYAGPGSITTGFQALSVLRLLSHRQSFGEVQANAHSLHDLCQLAVAACTSAERLLLPATTPLGRVDRAAAIDRLRAAATGWEAADRKLYPRVQAVVRAPRVYRDAITILGADCPTSPALTRAVLACLPRLATDAGQALLSHAGSNGLVVARRDPGKLTARWRPIEPATAASLAAAMVAAGRATRTASSAVTRHLDGSSSNRTTAVPERIVTTAERPHGHLRTQREATP